MVPLTCRHVPVRSILRGIVTLALAATTVPGAMFPLSAAITPPPIVLADDDELPDELLDDLSLMLGSAGGGANGLIGKRCDISAAPGAAPACQVARNEIMHVPVSGAINAQNWPVTPPPTLVLHLPDGRELGPISEVFGTQYWWIPLDAPLGAAVLEMRQGARRAQTQVSVTARRPEPLLAAGWERQGPDAPTELTPAGRAGDEHRVRLAGFDPQQDVTLLRYRLVESRALGDLAAFDGVIDITRVDERGQGTTRWETPRDQAPGHYAIHTIPRSDSQCFLPSQGVQLCVAPRSGPEQCPTASHAVEPDVVIIPLIQRTVTRAAKIWRELAGSPSAPLSELNCVYAANARGNRAAELQALRRQGARLEAHMIRKPRIQSMVETDPTVNDSGIIATVIERWEGQIERRDGSVEALESGRQTWRYHMKQGATSSHSPNVSRCGAELMITRMELVD